MTSPKRPLPPLPPRKPNGELLLAQALDACILAERAQPGSSAAIIARQPAWARAELRQLVTLVHSLDASGSGIGPSAEFTEAARERLIHGITGGATLARTRLTPMKGRSRSSRIPRWKWLVRGSVGLLAAILATTATLTASASSLPGDPLYGIKQAQEELNLRLATDEQARVLALLGRADARLEETSRLLQQGRTSEAVAVAQLYDQSVERATSAFVVTADRHDEPERYQHLESALGEQQERLQAIIQSAPEPARPDLREALATTERGRELMADPRPVERALGLRQRPPAAAAAAPPPATQTEEEPTSIPTATSVPPTSVRPTATPVDVVAARVDRSDDDADRTRERNDDRPAIAVTTRSANNSGSNSGRGNTTQQQPPVNRASDQQSADDEHREESPEVAVQPPVVQRPSSDDRRDSDNASRDERPSVARATQPPAAPAAPALEARATQPPAAPAAPALEARTSRSSNANSGSGSSESNTGSRSAQVATPQPTPTTVRATPARSVDSRSAPTATATPTAKRTGEVRQDSSNRGDDNRSSSGSGDHRGSGNDD